LPYSGNTIKRISNKRKGYFIDPGLICYLQRLPSPEALASSPFLGAVFESFCVAMLMALSQALPVQPYFYHWRSHNGAEVDLILDYNGALYPIEIKCKTNLNKYDLRGLRAFRETYPNANIQKALILYCGTHILQLDENTLAMPWFAYTPNLLF